MRRIRVLTTQEQMRGEPLEGATVVVLDVVLATTTLLTILENGARGVFVAPSVEDVERVCSAADRVMPLRGGEQNALPVVGYDCGPMPHEYSAERVSGRDVVYVSTNGTRAIGGAAAADRVVIACLRNAPAVARWLDAAVPARVYVVCAGSKGRFSLDDFIGAGVLLAHLAADGWQLDDAAALARDVGVRHPDPTALLREGWAGRWLVEHDCADVLAYVAAVGASDVLAEVRGGELVRMPAAGAP